MKLPFQSLQYWPLSYRAVDQWMPLVFLGLAFYEILSQNRFSSFEKHAWAWISSVIFFNSIHVTMTFVNLMYLPEFKAVTSHYGFTWKKHALFLGGIFLLFALGHSSGFFKRFYYLEFVVAAIVILVPLWHGSMQSLGISFLFNSRIRAKLPAKECIDFNRRDDRSRKLEHIGMACLTIGSILMSTPFIQLFPKRHLTVFLTPLAPIGYPLSALGLFLIMWGIISLGMKELIVSKLLFSLRYVLVPLLPFSFWAVIGLKCIHGTEATLLQAQYVKRSRLQKSLFPAFLTMIIIFGLAKVFFDFPIRQLNFNLLDADSVVGKVAILIGLATSYYHYYLDGILFRMRDPKIRAEILPLLFDLPAKSDLPSSESNDSFRKTA